MLLMQVAFCVVHVEFTFAVYTRLCSMGGLIPLETAILTVTVPDTAHCTSYECLLDLLVLNGSLWDAL